MESREAAFKALDEGKELTSTVTGIRYKQINGVLFAKSSDRTEWTLSGLSFYNPVSWLNLQE